MHVTFSFMAGHGSFSAELPDGLPTTPSWATVLAGPNGNHDLVVLPGEQLQTDYVLDTFVGVVESASGPAHVFRRVNGATYHTVRWQLPSGVAATSVSTEFDKDAVQKLLDSVEISEPRPGHPQVRLRAPYAFGSLGRSGEQDWVQFLKEAAPAGEPPIAEPWSVCFRFAGREAHSAVANGGDVIVVSAATPHGVAVDADGPIEALDLLRTVASDIASTIRPG